MPIQRIKINTNVTPTINHSIVFNDSRIYTTAIPNSMKEPNNRTYAAAKHSASNLLTLLPPYETYKYHVIVHVIHLIVP